MKVERQKMKECVCDIHEWVEEYYGFRCAKCGIFSQDNGFKLEDDDYDQRKIDYPECSLCSCIIGDEVEYGGEGISFGEVYCERCYE